VRDEPKKVELKSTVEAPDVDDALKKLERRVGGRDGQLALISFCDTRSPGGHLALDARGLIVRLRWRSGFGDDSRGEVENDVTVKLRPAVGDLASLAATGGDDDDDKLEGDWTPSKRTNSYSRKVTGIGTDELRKVCQHAATVQDVLSPGQRAFLAFVLGDDLPKALRCFAPVIATSWELDDGREAELWTLGAARFLEISERVDVEDADEKLADHQRFISRLGIKVGDAGPKTSRVLDMASRVGLAPGAT